MATTRPSYTKLTCPSPTTTTKGARGPRFHTTGDEVPHAKDSFARQLKPNGRSTSCASFPHLLLLQLHRRNRKDRRQAYSLLLQTTMEPLPHGLWSCLPASHCPAGPDKLKDASATGTTGDTPFTGTLPLPDKDSSQDDMPCRHTTPLRLLLLLLLQRNHDDETSRKEARYSHEQTFASRTP